MDRTSIRIRFLTSFTSNILQVALSFITGLIIARTLGPSYYGDFHFLLGSFTALAALVDMASSSAFYTFISQKKHGKNFFLYYAGWILIQFIIVVLLVLLLPSSLKTKIWLGHSEELVILALFASFTINQIWKFIGYIGESIRDTVGLQVRNMALAVTYLLCITLLVYFHFINVKALFILNGVLYLVFATLYGWKLYLKGTISAKRSESIFTIFHEFKSYCSPLILFTWVGFLYFFADFWLLQKFGGPIQQGYYAIGARMAALSLLATSSIVQILWKEIAEAYSLGNMERVRSIYHQVSRIFYFMGAVISCLLIPFSREILTFLLGNSYQDAWFPLSLMFLYPIHQSMGQINGTMLYGIGKTKTRANIGMFFMAISIPTAYLLLAPKSNIIPGLQLGAVGMALKMVGWQLFSVNIMAFYVARYLNTSFDWRYQINVLLLLLPISFFSKICAQWIISLLSFSHHFIVIITISTILYLGTLTALIYLFPSLAGIKRDLINNSFTWLRKQFNLA